MGKVGDFVIAPGIDGYTWEIPARPVTIRYAAVEKAGSLREISDQTRPGKEPLRFFEMTLKRIGNTGRSGEGAIS